MKKEKNTPILIPLTEILSQFSNPQYLSRYKNDPQQLANQIDDLKTIIKFTMTSFQQKTKNATKKMNEYSKGINNSRLSLKKYIDDISFKVNTFSSNQKLAYEILKKTSKPIIQEADYVIDCRKIFTQMKLKYLESQGLTGQEWNYMYNSIQRCLDLGRETFTLIKVGMRLQKGKFLWNIIKILYNQNENPILNQYYSKQLMDWMKKEYPDCKERQANMLAILIKSVDYTEVALLYMVIKQLQVNLNINEQDKQNYIYKLFDQNDLQGQFSQKKNKQSTQMQNNIKQKKIQQQEKKILSLSQSIKIRFNLVHTQFFPSLNITKNDDPLINIEFNDNSTTVKIKIINPITRTSIRLTAKFKNISFNINSIKKITIEVIKLNKIFSEFCFKMNQLKNQFCHLSKLRLLAKIPGVSKEVFLSEGLQTQKIQSMFEAKQNGLYLIHEYLSKYLSDNTFLFIKISEKNQLSSRLIEAGYINKLLSRTGIKFAEGLMHIQLQKYILNKNWDWDFKLYYVNCTKDKEFVHYVFRQQNHSKNLYKNINKIDIDFNEQKRKESNSTYIINVKVTSNFKKVRIFYSKQNQVGIEIQQKYFTDEWIKIQKDCEQNGKYLPIEELFNNIYYTLNHFIFYRVFNQPNMNDTKNLYHIQLMSE